MPARFCIILGMEGGEAGCEEKADELQREYAKKFWRIAHSVHARGIPGETSGKHSNENAAGRFAYKMLVKEQNIPIDSILLTCMDADCLHTENYFLKIDAAMQKEPKLGYNTIFACAFFNYQNMMDPRVSIATELHARVDRGGEVLWDGGGREKVESRSPVRFEAHSTNLLHPSGAMYSHLCASGSQVQCLL